ncbi:hypothetical protein KKC32_04360 [Patescibacteria group bacterium]|nr:hypothetical protein [Patescibacteria group bacterium]
MEPYNIWFGELNGKAVEQLMFDPKGYSFLKKIPRLFASDKSKRNLIARVEKVLALGENSRVMLKCDCNRPAAVVLCDDSGGRTVFLKCFCEECVPKVLGYRRWIVALKFSSILSFSRSDQKEFIGILKSALGIFGAVTKDNAFKCFFPDEPVRKKSPAVQLFLAF